MKIACVQSNVVFGDHTANAENAIHRLNDLSQLGVQLAVFPEAYLTGYCVDSAEAARGIALDVDGPILPLIAETCTALGMHAVVGFAESAGDGVTNAAAIFQPGKPFDVYRKTHLPELGFDRFATPGHALPVFDTALGKIGILICFDLRIPEAARVLTLAGAELIVLPTNWPQGAEVSADFLGIARAAENRVYVATCDRVGTENGFTFIGRSKIIDVTGKVLAAAGSDEEVIVADIDLALARNKRSVTIPGKYETDAIATRQPNLYRNLIEPRS